MNVYDEAHNLERSIRESHEFQEFDRLRKEIEKDPQLSDMMKQLQEMQMQMQAAQVTGQEVDADLMSRLQGLATMVATKPLAAQYMQAEGAFMLMINDVFGIIGEAIGIK